MKKFALLLMTIATLSFCACGDNQGKPNNPTELPTIESLVNTSWQGTYYDHVVHPQAGQLDAEMKWTVDFLPDGQGEALLELTIGGQSQDGRTNPFQYEYDGKEGKGKIIVDAGEDIFEVDAVNRTITLELGVQTGFSAERPQNIGGTTVLHQIQ